MADDVGIFDELVEAKAVIRWLYGQKIFTTLF